MTRQRSFPFICLLLFLIVLSGCRDNTPAVQQATDTPTSAATDEPTATASAATEAVDPTATNTQAPAATDTAQPTATQSTNADSGLTLLSHSDTLPAPRLISRTPVAAQELMLEDVIELQFDQPVDVASLEAALQFLDADDNAIDGTLESPQPRVVRFRPSSKLVPDTNYRLVIGAGALAENGVPFGSETVLGFTTVGPIEVASIRPFDGVETARLTAPITVVFNRPIIPLGVNETTGSPILIEPAIEGEGGWTSTSVYTFQPDGFLRSNETYVITVDADAVNQLSATGAMLEESVTSTFSTAAPSIRRFSYADSRRALTGPQSDMPLDAAFRLTFQQPMDVETTESAIKMIDTDASTQADLHFSWFDNNQTVVFSSTQLLELSTNYAVVVETSAETPNGGNLAQQLRWTGQTVALPRIEQTHPEYGDSGGRYTDRFEITFSTPIDPDSAEGLVTFEPPLIGDRDPYYSRWDNSLRYYGLEAATTYTVTIQPGIADVYGNTIDTGQTVLFTTGNVPPSMSVKLPQFGWYGQQLALFRSGGTNAIWVSHRNLGELNVTLSEMSIDELMEYHLEDSSYYRPDDEAYIRNKVFQFEDAQPNVSQFERFLLQDDAGSALTPGLYFVSFSTPDIENKRSAYDDSVPVVVANTNLTLKTTGKEVLVWVTDLTTAKPLANIDVAIYDSSGNVVYRGMSDANGLMRGDVELEVGYGVEYYAVAETAGVYGLAIRTWDDGLGPWEFGINSDFWRELGETSAYIYTDRPLYRPGQTVSVKGIVRDDYDLDWTVPASQTVDVTVRSWEETILRRTVELSEFGTFEAQFELDDEATLGDYSITVSTGPDGNTTDVGYASFGLASYRKPTFQVMVTPESADIVTGDTLRATVDTSFFSGGSVGNADVEWVIIADSYIFYPNNSALSRYRFNNSQNYRSSYYNYGGGNFGTTIASGTGITDLDGRYVIEYPAELLADEGSQTYRVEATVSDGNGTFVSARNSVTVHAGDTYIGVRSDSYIAKTNELLAFGVVTVDRFGELQPNATFDAVLNQREWLSVQETDDYGRKIWRSEMRLTPVMTKTGLTTDASAEATTIFTPTKGGSYVLVTTVADSAGRTNSANSFVWVTSREYVSWRQTNDHIFDLVLDANDYKPGDTAQLLIASPFQGRATALVTIERGRIKTTQVVELETNSATVDIPITAEYAPNAFINVVLLKGVDDFTPAPDFKMGYIQLNVERVEQELDIEISADREVLGAGDEVEFTVKVTDHTGGPVEAELSLALTDLAALSLAPRRERPILDYFYSSRWLGVRTSLLLSRLMDNFNAELEEEIKGGGGGGPDMGVVEIREDFPDTAYWNGQLITDENGEARVTITLPDSLTTWRLDARAVTRDTKVGQATADIRTTRPLIVSPFTPRFFVSEDKAQVGALIHNNSESELLTDVSLQIDGAELLDPGTQQVSIPAGQQAVVTWNIVVNRVEKGDARGRVDAVFSATGGEFFDASRPMLTTLPGGGIPVYKYVTPATVGTSGQLLDEGAVVEAIALPVYDDWNDLDGSVTVRVQPSLAAAMTDGLDYLTHYPYECTEQIVSKFLPNVITTQALRDLDLSDPVLEQQLSDQVDIALQKLYARQKSNGGFQWWDDDRSETDTLVTAWVLQSLLEARDAGYTVSDGVVTRAGNYLKNNVATANKMQGRFKSNRQAYIEMVLSRVEKSTPSRLSDLFEQRNTLDLYAQGFLVQALYYTDPEDPRIETLRSELLQAVTATASAAHWSERTRDYWNWNSNTRSTAIVLESLLVTGSADDPQLANAVRWLMAHRQSGHWGSTQDTAWTVMALTSWMVETQELTPDFLFEVALNGEAVEQRQMTSDNVRDSIDITADLDSLDVNNLNRVAIGRTAGPGNLYYTTLLNVEEPVEQVEAVSNGITISRSYYQPDDRDTPVTSAEQGDLLIARLTIVVPTTRYYVAIDDFLPAGLEAVDASLLTSPQESAPDTYNGDTWRRGWGWWYFDHVELRDERVVISADYIPGGTYEYVYTVRASSVGEFRTIPPSAHEFYFPEVNGRGDGMIFTVIP